MGRKQKQWYDRVASYLLKRKWADVAEAWESTHYNGCRHVVSQGQSIANLKSLYDLEAQKNLQLNEKTDCLDRLEGLAELVLTEAVVLTFKASNVLYSSELDQRDGLNSWSMSNAYHSAFFSVKAILAFLGITIAAYDNRTLLVDLFCFDTRKRSRREVNANPYFTRVTSVRKIDQHLPIWCFLQRILRIIEIKQGIWPAIWIETLRDLPLKQFTRQRRKLHYENMEWIFDDLFETHRLGNSLQTKHDFSEVQHRNDFSFAVAVVLFSMAASLMRQLTESDKQIASDFQTLLSIMNKPERENYRSVLLQVVPYHTESESEWQLFN